MIEFHQIQSAERQVYLALRPLPKQQRDCLLRNVLDALNSERAPLRMRVVPPGQIEVGQ